MPRVRNIFVSHSYRHDGMRQHDLIGMLKARRRFFFQDHSIRDVSLYRGNRLRAEIRRRIERSEVVLVISRPAIAKSANIVFELRLAQKLGKPIIAVRPPDAQNIAAMTRECAVAVVDWDVEQIIHQIRNPGAPITPPVDASHADDLDETAVGPASVGVLRDHAETPTIPIDQITQRPSELTSPEPRLSPREVLKGIRNVPQEQPAATSVVLPPEWPRRDRLN